ncbi:hypothetical protein [Pseudomonas aeruginosa]|uniref:hypothetical protein n=1 Tax=Pseudomonas aeruginosa TaxID=287 RepID=UPI00053D0D1D|nr:hypothetical protein [Pseudomonas aeruginosa]
MSQKTEQDSRPIAEAVDLPEISAEHSTELLTGSAPCAGVSRPLPAAWLGQRGIYRSRLEAVCNGEQLADPLTLGELIQHAWRYLYLTRRAGLGLKPARQPLTSTTKTPEATDAAVDQMIAEEDADIRQDLTQQAEAERPEVVAVMESNGAGGKRLAQRFPIVNVFVGDELMTVAQHERIVGAVRAKTACTMGVGGGDGQLFVHGDHASIKAAQKIVLERDAALARVAELEQSTDNLRQDRKRLTSQAVKHRDEIEALRAKLAEQAEAERPEQPKRHTADVFYHNHFSTVQMEVVRASDFDEFAAQHERIVGELRTKADQLREALEWRKENQAGQRELLRSVTAERDAALANVDALAVQVLKLGGTISFAHHRTDQAGQVPQAWLDVQAERRRQIEAEGWTPEHDDAHSHGQMARAAACYALAGSSAPNDGTAALLVSLAWPWDEQWWKPTSARRDLVKACALALAEIERLDRAAASRGGPSDA